MSNDSKASHRRRKYNIESNKITPAENATVKSVMARLMGRDAPPPEVPVQDKRNQSLENPASLAVVASPEEFSRQEDSASQANNDKDARKFSSQADSSSLANSSALIAQPQPDILASLPEVKGHLRLNNQLVDHLFPQLTPPEAIVYLHLYRLSRGFGNPTCIISYPGIARRSNMSSRSAQDVTARLQGKGLIEKVRQIIGAGKEQGIEWRIAIHASQEKLASHAVFARLEESATNKVNTQKENTHTIGVRVGSRFSLEECRRYAEHLRSTGQGINNPGGYATTIHRTGEADMLIESFLHPEAQDSSSNLDASKCPDCNGTGFYYPRGTEAGVARCKHEQLRKEGE